MPHIPLSDYLPGITVLLEYRLDTALPIRELTQILLRGNPPSTNSAKGESALSHGERELIAALVSSRNGTNHYCLFIHLFCSRENWFLGGPDR